MALLKILIKYNILINLKLVCYIFKNERINLIFSLYTRIYNILYLLYNISIKLYFLHFSQLYTVLYLFFQSRTPINLLFISLGIYIHKRFCSIPTYPFNFYNRDLNPFFSFTVLYMRFSRVTELE